MGYIILGQARLVSRYATWDTAGVLMVCALGDGTLEYGNDVSAGNPD